MPIDRLPNDDMDRDLFRYSSGSTNTYVGAGSLGTEGTLNLTIDSPGEIWELYWQVTRDDDSVGPIEIAIVPAGDYSEIHEEVFHSNKQLVTGNLLVTYEMLNAGGATQIGFDYTNGDDNNGVTMTCSWQAVKVRRGSNTSAVYSLSDSEESFD